MSGFYEIKVVNGVISRYSSVLDAFISRLLHLCKLYDKLMSTANNDVAERVPGRTAVEGSALLRSISIEIKRLLRNSSTSWERVLDAYLIRRGKCICLLAEYMGVSAPSIDLLRSLQDVWWINTFYATYASLPWCSHAIAIAK